MSDKMEKLQAWMELTEAKARYCRLLDTKDWDGFGALMTDDFELDLSGTSDLGIFKGRNAALAQIRSSIETAITAHQVHSPEITLEESAEEALVIWPMNDRVIWSEDRPSLVGYGHYNEHWLKRDGQWRLASQRLTRPHMDFLPPAKAG